VASEDVLKDDPMKCKKECYIILYMMFSNHISGVMVIVLLECDCGFKPRSSQTKDLWNWYLLLSSHAHSINE